MAAYVRDDGLLSECKACCAKDAATTKYSKAVLEICQFKLNGLPQVDDFIKKRAAKFGKALRVQYRHGAVPRLLLSGSSDGSSGSSIRIDQWRAAAIDEYLTERLQLPKA